LGTSLCTCTPSMSDNPHSERLKHAEKHGNSDPSPYGRAMQKIGAINAADKEHEAKVRTITDLLDAAGITEEDDVELPSTLTLSELNGTYKDGEAQKKNGGGRTALLSRFKDEGVAKLSHRQKLASAFVKVKRDGRLRLRSAKAEGDSAESSRGDAAAEEMDLTPEEAAAEAAKAAEAAAKRAKQAALASRPAPAPDLYEATPATVIPNGERVKIFGLMSRPDLNGRYGKVQSYSSERGRYTVDVQGEMMALRSDNLRAEHAEQTVQID